MTDTPNTRGAGIEKEKVPEDVQQVTAPNSTAVSRSPSVTLGPGAQGLWTKLRRTRLGSGIYNDVRSRLPYYASDWTDAWNYRVVPAVVLIFFAK